MIAFEFLEYVLFCSAIALNAVSYTDSSIYPKNYEELFGTHTLYTLFENGRSWNEARAVCKRIGGDLAKVPNDIDVTAMKAEHTTVKKFFEDKYFSSAVRLTGDQYLWMSDCSIGTVSKSSRFTMFADNINPCVKVHKDHFHHADCNSDTAPFLCETKTRTPCNLVKMLDTKVIKLENMTESDCNNLCNGDVTCWAAITTPTHCFKGNISGYGLSSLSVSTKQCNGDTYEVHVNASSFALPPELRTSALQDTTPPDCDIDHGTTPPLPTLTSPAPPKDIISTKMVTITQFSTIFVTSTKYIVDPTPQITDTDQTTLSVTTTMTSQIDTDSVTFTSTSAVNYSTYLVTINPKNTSTYRRSVTSASDTRKTSLVIGISSVTLVIIPLWILILSDLKTIIQHFFNHETLYSKKKSSSKVQSVTATT